MNYQDLDLVLLKHIISSKRNALEFLHDGDEKLFSSDAWRFVKIILSHVKSYKDVPTQKIINEQIGNNEALLKYVNTIWEDVNKISADSREYKHDLAKIKNRFTEKLIYNLKDQLADANGNIDIKKGISEISAVATHIKNINTPRSYEQKSLKECLSDIRARYIAKQNDPKYGTGLKIGFEFFDEIVGGMRDAESLLFVGGTGSGKSICLNHAAKSLWMGENTIDSTEFSKGCDVVYFSLEMPMADCQERIFASMAGVPQVGIRDATLNEEQKQKMGKAMKFIERYPYDLTIVDAPRGLTPESMELIFNDLTESKGKKPKAVIIDYLALMNYNEPELDDWLKQGKLAEAVSEFGRVHNIITLTAAQMTTDNNNKPGTGSMGTHRLSRSRMIGHNMNFILMIEQRQNEQQRPDFPLHMVKSRRSALTVGTMYKNLHCCELLNKMPDTIQDELNDSSADIDEMISA